MSNTSNSVRPSLTMTKVLKKMHRSREDRLRELCADAFSDWPGDFGSQLADSPWSEDSDESDVRPSRRQKRNVMVSASESDSEEEWAEKSILPWRIIQIFPA